MDDSVDWQKGDKSSGENIKELVSIKSKLLAHILLPRLPNSGESNLHEN